MTASNEKRSILITGLVKTNNSQEIDNDTNPGYYCRCSEGGSGNALALAFASQGLRVFATARSLHTLTNLEAKGIETLVLDVTDPESITNLRDEIQKRTNGKLDILMNNAGTMYEAPALEADPSKIKSMFETNVFGLFNVVTAFTPLLLASVPGSKTAPVIVSVASVLARLPYPFSSAYNASKAAVAVYSDTLRLELDPLGIRVVTLYMGEVSTKLMSPDNILFGADSIYSDLEDKVKERSRIHGDTSISATAFAQQVMGKVLNSNTNYIWKGSKALLVWFLDAFGPKKVFDSTMTQSVGLDNEVLRKKIRERAEKITAKS
ncbi:hypothetical protein FGRMN_2765 [Fusarium graminum]|nr:hypothetical protein FGRMN_2765 [Fusarium graminum]